MAILRIPFIAALLFAGFAVPAWGSFHTFVINEIFSSADGTVQFVELREAQGADGQQFLAGHTLTVTQGGTTRTFTFATNLPGATTANRFVLMATQAFANLNAVAPDYILPPNFLFANGGTLNFADVDVVVYTALPTDGRSSINRALASAVNSPTNFAGATGSINLAAAPAGPPSAIPSLSGAMLLVLTMGVALVTFARRR